MDRGNPRVTNTYGTNRVNAYKIIEDTLNLRDTRVFDYVEDEEGKRKPNPEQKGNRYCAGQAGSDQAGVPGMDLERSQAQAEADRRL